jgi:hypothetical protein
VRPKIRQLHTSRSVVVVVLHSRGTLLRRRRLLLLLLAVYGGNHLQEGVVLVQINVVVTTVAPRHFT